MIAGLPEDPTLKTLGVTKSTMDDYLLLLCLDPDAVRAFCEGARIAHKPVAADLHRLIAELGGVLRAKEVVIDSSKRYMDLVRAVVGFQGARATFAQDLIRKCPDLVRERVLGSLARQVTADPPLPAGM